jgi:hypothetical protein
MKVIKKNEHLDIDYLWMDKLCINQKDQEEKAHEVRHMFRNYSNGSITLVAINSNSGIKKDGDFVDLIEILKKIVNSR